MEIYDRKRGKAATMNVAPHISLTPNTIYVSVGAVKAIGLTKKKKVVYGKKYQSLMVGIADKTNPAVTGWNPSFSKSSASVGIPRLLPEKFTKGKYTFGKDHEKNGVTWYKLTKWK